MPIREVGPVEASEIRRAERTAILLDVRTVEEFEQGHPKGALNIPVVLPSVIATRSRWSPPPMGSCTRKTKPAGSPWSIPT